MKNKMPPGDIRIGVTMGDPSGIGPEILLKSFRHDEINACRIIAIGDFNVLHAVHGLLKIESFGLNRIDDLNRARFEKQTLNILDLDLANMDELSPGKVQAGSGNIAFECIRRAASLALGNALDAIVTAPVCKEALHLAGHRYAGHTELFAALAGTRDYAMLLHDPRLSVVHVSTHVSLLEAVTGLKQERIEKVIELANLAMKKLGKPEPRIGVSGINPHSGENGLFGNEEIHHILPAIRKMRERGMDVEGPVPPDVVFLQSIKGKYDVVVAMYHDQGHIPLKLIGFERGVNVTLGLPFVRTSVDHGTAFDIAWQGKASEESMVEAIKLSLKLAR